MTTCKPHILLIEDEHRLAQCLALVLRDIGYEVTIAADGWSGIQALTLRSFDLVLLDWHLPRCSGLEVCRWLQQRPIAPPIVVVTAYSGPERVEAAQQAGANGYLVKPFNTDELMDLVCRLLPENCLSLA
ncbi:MAG: response regulator [Cyanobacteria bacterium P01_A01_bin.135]